MQKYIYKIYIFRNSKVKITINTHPPPTPEEKKNPKNATNTKLILQVQDPSWGVQLLYRWGIS